MQNDGEEDDSAKLGDASQVVMGVVKKTQWGRSGEGDDATRGEKWGTDAIVAMEEMIWQDGYVAYGCEWKMVGERERENRVPGGKETPISKSSCKPVTVVPSICWALPSHHRGQGLSHWIQLLEVLPY